MTWAQKHDIKHNLIQPRKPTQTADVEGFKGPFKAKGRDENWFESLAQPWHRPDRRFIDEEGTKTRSIHTAPSEACRLRKHSAITTPSSRVANLGFLEG